MYAVVGKVQAGESCEIKWMFGNADVMNFLERYGIKEGSRIRVLGRVLDGLIIGNGKVRLALGDGSGRADSGVGLTVIEDCRKCHVLKERRICHVQV